MSASDFMINLKFHREVLKIILLTNQMHRYNRKKVNTDHALVYFVIDLSSSIRCDIKAFFNILSVAVFFLIYQEAFPVYIIITSSMSAYIKNCLGK